MPNTVPMQQGVYDLKKRLSPGQQDFLTQILRLFTQGDVDVAAGYVNNYLPVCPQPEVRMMLLGFAAREAVHANRAIATATAITDLCDQLSISSAVAMTTALLALQGESVL